MPPTELSRLLSADGKRAIGRVPTESGVDLKTIWAPNSSPQTSFLSSSAREVLYGGAVGGGKSDALVAAPLRWVGNPKHRAVLFRRERPDLQEVIDRMREIYPQVVKGARWVETRSRFEMPTGSYIQVGHSERASDIEAYKSFEFNWIGFDELTTFLREIYVYMLSRNRSKSEDLPLHMRSGTNPDGEGHAWVFEHFIDKKLPYQVYRYLSEIRDPNTGETRKIATTRQFIPATVFDNPDLTNKDAYIAGLQKMGKGLSEALLYGRWDYFRGQMFPYGPTAGLVLVEHGLKEAYHYVVRCLDYGYADPTVVKWLVVYPGLVDEHGLPLVEIADSLRLEESSVTTIAALIKRREERLAAEGLSLPARFSAADPSIKRREGTSKGRSILDMLQQQGVWFELANNDREAGWAYVRQFLENGRLRVWRGRDQWLVSTLPKLVRDSKKREDIAPRQDDHDADTLRYGLMEIYEQPVAPRGPVEVHPRQDLHYEELKQALQGSRGRPIFDSRLGEGW